MYGKQIGRKRLLCTMECFSGTVITSDGPINGYVLTENGIIKEIIEGKCPEPPLYHGVIMPPLVNGHSHCADYGMDISKNSDLDKLVGPGGMKHKYLSNVSNETLSENMKKYSELSYSNGIGTFIDFREGGVEGCRILREAVPDMPFILGRPVSDEFDSNEIDEILEIADGIGLSGMEDLPYSYIESVADYVNSKGRMFAIHASEGKRDDIDKVIALSPSFVVHMSSAEKKDLIRCADEDIPIVVCPRSNEYFGFTPPLALMEECGNETILGTDNAMICSPDLRKEAERYISVLKSQGGIGDEIWNTLVLNGRKILYHVRGIGLQSGIDADITIFPSSDGSVNGMLKSNKAVIRYNRAKRVT